MKLGELGEFGLIEKIRQKAPKSAGVYRGIGDDAAEVELPAGHRLLTSTDLLIESIHFRLDWTDAEALGHKAIAVNLSDIAAMGGTPRYLYLGVACPAETEASELEAFLAGALAEAQEHGAVLVGGDTCRSPGPWIISVTVEGSAPLGQAVGRDGAEPGDILMVSGTLGDSALALKLLNEGESPEESLLQRHHRPTPRVGLGLGLAERGLAKAMIDISDGLAADLQHILRESKVDAIVELSQLPLSDGFKQHALPGRDLQRLSLYGGEDYELLFSVAPQRVNEVFALGKAIGVDISVIGALRQGAGTAIGRDARGQTQPLAGRGFEHFSS